MGAPAKRRRSKKDKKRNQQRKPDRGRRQVSGPEETRAAEALTVAWTIALLATSFATATLLGLQWAGPDAVPAAIVTAFSVIAISCGIVTIAMTAPVVKVRRRPPPKSLVWAAVIIGALPVAVGMWISSS